MSALLSSPDRILDLPGYGKPKTLQLSGYACAEPCHTENCQEHPSIFYWFVAAAKDYANKPIIVWTGGGPGSSAFYGFFFENGPYLVENKNLLSDRKSSWHQLANYIIFDQPVGVGLSFATKKEVPNDVHEGTDQFYYALANFLAKHPQFKNNPVYIASESYGGTYVPLLAQKIMQENQRLLNTKGLAPINLKGIIVIDGWVAPELQQSKDAEYAFTHGLISRAQYQQITAEYELCHQAMQKDCNAAATSQLAAKMDESIRKFSQRYLLNIAQPQPPNYQAALDYLNRTVVRKAIHAKPKPKVTLCSDQVFNNYQVGQQVSYANVYAELLAKNVPVLIFSGLNDATDCNYLGTELWLHSIDWPGAKQWQQATTTVWKDPISKDVLGYQQTGGGLQWIKVLNAGHMVPMDQPRISQIIQQFIKA